MQQIKHPNINEVSLANILYALSDPTRLKMLALLANGKPLTCGDLSFDRPKSSMSHHFRILREAGIIETSISGKEHFNTLRTDELNQRFPGVIVSIVKAI